MRERALKFGKTASLAGVLTEPTGGASAPDRPGVIFLNSGILHHTGASRLYVKIARRLAADGFTSLRFDFSGVGDSEARKDTLPFAKAAVVEGREAMDFLQEGRGMKSFILMGLCSGADMAYHIALADERVAGLAKIDAWVYSTRRAVVRHYVPRVLSLRQWRHSIRVRLEGRRARAGQSPQDPSASLYVAPEYRRKFPPREEVEDGLRRLTERGVRLYYFFSGDQISVFNYREQYRESFPDVDFRDLLTVDFQPDSDHTVTGLRHQEEVTDAIHRWAVAGWGHPATEQAAASEAVLSGTARGD
jgi:pimeloyl-ACP methyl ester carboxylesterase